MKSTDVIAVSAYALSPKPRTVDMTHASRHSVLKLSLCQTEACRVKSRATVQTRAVFTVQYTGPSESSHCNNTTVTSTLNSSAVQQLMNTNCHQFLSRSSQSYLRQNTKWHVIRFCKQKLHYDLSIGGKHHFSTITSSKVNGMYQEIVELQKRLTHCREVFKCKLFFRLILNQPSRIPLFSCKELSQDKRRKPLNISVSICKGPTSLKKEATIRNKNSKPNQARQQ